MTTEAKDKTDNEAIAIFMGAEFVRKPDSFDPDKYHETYIFKGMPNNWRDRETKYHYTAPMLLYRTDWDWLMPVVEKITSKPNTIVKMEAYPDDKSECLIIVDGGVVTGHYNGPLLKATYMSVVEYIKQHNANQPKP